MPHCVDTWGRMSWPRPRCQHFGSIGGCIRRQPARTVSLCKLGLSLRGPTHLAVIFFIKWQTLKKHSREKHARKAWQFRFSLSRRPKNLNMRPRAIEKSSAMWIKVPSRSHFFQSWIFGSGISEGSRRSYAPHAWDRGAMMFFWNGAGAKVFARAWNHSAKFASQGGTELPDFA